MYSIHCTAYILDNTVMWQTLAHWHSQLKDRKIWCGQYLSVFQPQPPLLQTSPRLFPGPPHLSMSPGLSQRGKLWTAMRYHSPTRDLAVGSTTPTLLLWMVLPGSTHWQDCRSSVTTLWLWWQKMTLGGVKGPVRMLWPWQMVCWSVDISYHHLFWIIQRSQMDDIALLLTSACV